MAKSHVRAVVSRQAFLMIARDSEKLFAAGFSIRPCVTLLLDTVGSGSFPLPQLLYPTARDCPCGTLPGATWTHIWQPHIPILVELNWSPDRSALESSL